MKQEIKNQMSCEFRSMIIWLSVVLGIESLCFLGRYYRVPCKSKERKKECEEIIRRIMSMPELHDNNLRIKRNEKKVSTRIDLTNLNQSKRPKKRS